MIGGVMNKQYKSPTSRGIEWTDYTWNPISGCFHACQWAMPDGSIANCYAEDVATRVAGSAYPHGFEHHYWKPEALEEPAKLRKSSRIFVGSMADVFGHWVPEEQINAVLSVCRHNPQHTFQFLTKNPRRVLQFDWRIPKNCWIGASTPPDFMWGKALSDVQRQRMLKTTLDTLHSVRQTGIVTWLSAEPITIDVGAALMTYPGRSIDWMVIGAASNGAQKYAPSDELVRGAVRAADMLDVTLFFKGNLRTSPYASENWREEFPG